MLPNAYSFHQYCSASYQISNNLLGNHLTAADTTRCGEFHAPIQKQKTIVIVQTKTLLMALRNKLLSNKHLLVKHNIPAASDEF